MRSEPRGLYPRVTCESHRALGIRLNLHILLLTPSNSIFFFNYIWSLVEGGEHVEKVILFHHVGVEDWVLGQAQQ